MSEYQTRKTDLKSDLQSDMQSDLKSNEKFAVKTDNANNYCDCFSSTIDCAVDLEQFVYAFYTTRVFRLERKILALTLKLPATNEQAKLLASGESDNYSFWTVEKRRPSELLLLTNNRHTGSWFMVRDDMEASQSRTELLFGSVVFLGSQKTNLLFSIVLVFHKVYSRILLASAARRTVRLRAKPS